MVRGCLLALALYAFLVWGYYRWLDTVFEPPGSYGGAAAAGLVMLLSLGAWTNARRAFADWSLVAGADRGVRPRDRRLFAVLGTIHPVERPVSAPFSGSNCVICEYDVTSAARVERVSTRSDSAPGVDLTGFLMAPSLIRSKSHEMRLLGFPILEGFSKRALTSSAAVRRGREFAASHTFEDRAGLKIVTAISVLADVWADEDGAVDKHLRLCRQDPVSLFPLDADSDERMPLAEAAIESPRHARPADSEYEGDNEDDDESEDDFEDEDDSEEESEQLVLPRITPLITETLVRDGERVCAIGIYDEVRRGLLPPRGGTAPNRLICGTAESIVKQLRGKMVGNFWGGLIAMLVLHGVVLAAMQLYLHSPDTRNRLSRDAFEAVRQNNRARLAELLRRGMPVDIRDSSGDTLLMASRDAETARWLVEQKIDINAVDDHGMTALMRAAHEGRAEIVRLLIDARANLNVRSTEYGRTALMHADDAGQVACAEMLREAGAEDDVVTARTGQPLPVNGGEPLAVCRDYLAAVHAREPDKLLRLTVRDTIGTFEDVDWQSWQASRPVAIDRFQGYVRGEDATVSVSGLTGAGFRTTWVYQLRRVSGVWKIAREDWDVSSVRGAR